MHASSCLYFLSKLQEATEECRGICKLKEMIIRIFPPRFSTKSKVVKKQQPMFLKLQTSF